MDCITAAEKPNTLPRGNSLHGILCFEWMIAGSEWVVVTLLGTGLPATRIKGITSRDEERTLCMFRIQLLEPLHSSIHDACGFVTTVSLLKQVIVMSSVSVVFLYIFIIQHLSCMTIPPDHVLCS